MRARIETIEVSDGTFDAYVFPSTRPNGNAILLLHEIFGVVGYIEDVARRLNELGYLVMAPDLFWRLQPNLRLDPPDPHVDDAIAFASRFDWDSGVADCGAALERLGETSTGRVGVLGFCFGGTLAFRTGIEYGPDLVVSYYGSGVPDAVRDIGRITCPLLLHFGGSDPFIPSEAIDQVRNAAQPHANVELHVHPGATHAFDNHHSKVFHHPEAAQHAWELTLDFLRRHA